MKLLTFIPLLLFGFHSLSQEGKFVETNGVKIYYETHGSGEPLLLLHGFSLSHKAWDKWIDDLSKNYFLIIPDLRGHGNSTNDSDSFIFKESALDMYGLMDRLQIEKFNAIGQSGGASILIHMATMDSTRISSMILVAGTSFFSLNNRKQFAQISFEKWSGYMQPHHPGGDSQIKKLIKHAQEWAYSYDDVNFTPPYLSKIKCPTLIIHGDRDYFYPADMPLKLYKAIPNSYLWIVPNDGHIPIGIYDRKSIWSDVFLKVLNEFFDGSWI